MEGTPPPKTWWVGNGQGKKASGPFTVNDVVQAIRKGNVTSTRMIQNSSGDKKWLEAGRYTAFNEAFKPFKVWYLSNGTGKGKALGPFTKEDICKAIGEGKVTSVRRMSHRDTDKWADASNWSAFNEAFKPLKIWYVSNTGGDPQGPFTKDDILQAIKQGKVKADRKLCNVKVDKSKWSEARNWQTNGKGTFFR